MGLTQMDQYRAWAVECNERAQYASDPKIKSQWLKLAQSWQRLAEGSANATQPEMDKLRTYSG
jgi:hypothetical protein